MGYTTEYYGTFDLDRPLDDATYNMLRGLGTTRRMIRSTELLAKEHNMTYDQALEAFGADGEFYFGDSRISVTGPNQPPPTQPGLWCQWIPTEDRMSLEWDGGEKFYDGTDWIAYIIESILKPRGYVLNGRMDAEGEDHDDRWTLLVVNNTVITMRKKIVDDMRTMEVLTPSLDGDQFVYIPIEESRREAVLRYGYGAISLYSDIVKEEEDNGKDQGSDSGTRETAEDRPNRQQPPSDAEDSWRPY